MDEHIISMVKDFLWTPLVGLIVWAWKHNEKEHDMLRKASESALLAAQKAREDSSVSHSMVMDKMMVHIDNQFKEHTEMVRSEDTKLNDELNIHRQHIAKLFEKLEEARKDTATQFVNYSQRSEDRHREVMTSLQQITQSFHVALNQKADK